MTDLIERSALDLAAAIRRQELTAAEVVDAHIERHRQMAPRINALVVDRFRAARQEAHAADELVRTANGTNPLPSLLGVPFTVKESVALEAMPHSAGLVARGRHRADTTSPAVQRLVEAGAIPLGVTNTSELTLWIESVNRLYGRTRNPYDPRRVAGGSSGGEGAAVGSGGSPFGVASDIAGSIRVPAFFCGVFGHKPSSGLVPNSDLYPPSPGEAGRMLGVGPLTRRAEDLMPLLRIMAGPDGRDGLVRETHLGDPTEAALKGLPVTLLEDTTRLPLHRDIRAARDRAAEALRAHGATVRTVSLRSWRRALLPFLAALQDGSEQTTNDLLKAAGAPEPTWRSLLSRGGPHVLATRLTLAGEMLPPTRGRALKRQLAAAQRLSEELTATIGEGIVLHPAHPRVAPRHGSTIGRMWLLVPAAMFNLAGVPVTEVPLGLDEHGLPLGVQVAAGHDRDHVAIAAALELERAFGGWSPPPAP